MKLTDEQRAAVIEPGNCLVKACPGSGKTRAIIAKLLRVSEETKAKTRRIACVTYTNAAVNELLERIDRLGGMPGDCVEVSTIHTFCLQNVLRPFRHLLGGEIPKDFGILSLDSPEIIQVGTPIFGNRLKNFTFREQLLNIKQQDSSLFIPRDLNVADAARFYKAIRTAGLLTFGDIVYYSNRLVRRFPFIARSLASRFQHVIVDEFQDTSPEQASILTAILDTQRNHLLLVGDENQSIFSFSDARPDIFSSFASQSTVAIVERTFTGNFRCSSRICKVAELICPRTPSMESVGLSINYPAKVISISQGNGHTAILQHFIPAVQKAGIGFGECAVLAPQWYELRAIARHLIRNGVAVLGTGARPYRRATEFTGVAEAAAECTVAPSQQASIRLERALLFSIRTINRGGRIGGVSERRKAMCHIRRHARGLHESGVPAIQWLSELAEYTGNTLHGLDLISEAGKAQIEQTTLLMTIQIEETQQREGGTNLNINQLALFSDPKDAIQLSTIHSAKGQEWDAVAMVDLHDEKIPHRYSVNVDEARRLFYVGCTRPRKMLMLYHYQGRQATRFLNLLN